MSTIVTRSGKGSPLTHIEVDANFTNLNTDKAELSDVILTTQKGIAYGVAPLDAGSKISATYLPSYVDDVLEYANYAALPATGESSKIYVVLDTNKAYRWSGSVYIYITSGAVDSVAGKVGLVTLVAADIGGLSNSATIDATNATNISSGTLSVARLPASGVISDTYGTATQVTPFTIDDKGRITFAGTPVTIAPTFANIAAKPTTVSGFGITDALNTTSNTTAPLVNGDIGSATLTTSTTADNQIIDSNSATAYRSINYVVQITSELAYQACNITVIHDGTTAYITEYGDVTTNGFLAYFDADISGGNLRLLTTPVNAVTTYRIIKTMIDI